MTIPKTLFCGLSTSPQSWYRCGLPANELEQDWIGIVHGAPGNEGVIVGGNVPDEKIDIESYDVIIAQMAQGKDWLKFVKECQSRGQKVIYEVDDFVHGVHKVKGHHNSSAYNKKRVKRDFNPVMEQCDGMICSTEFLSDEYKKYNENQFVCKNGIDTKRYETKRPDNEEIIIGHSGGTGHDSSVVESLRAIHSLMELDDRIRFVCAGGEYAEAMATFYPDRCTTIPWTTLENYPYVISQFDISIAPGHESKYHKSKSDLRWLEASAGNIPVVGDPRIYQEIEDGKTGLLAQTESEYYEHLLDLTDPKEGESRRREISQSAKDYVVSNRDISVAAKQWEEVIKIV